MGDYKRICFMGTADFAVPILKELIACDYYRPLALVTQPDTVIGRKRDLHMPPAKVTALEHSIPCLQFTTFKDLANVQALRDLDLDLIVTAAYGKILPSSVLDLPKFGAINIHGSLLPELRGASPIQTAILQGKQETGVSIIKMVKAMDAGCIYAQYRQTIGPDMTYKDLEASLANLAARNIVKFLDAYFANQVQGVEQDENSVTYCHLLQREDGLLNWHEPALNLYNKIRAFYPWPDTFTDYGGKTMKIYSAALPQISDLTPHQQQILNDSLQKIKSANTQPDGKVVLNKGCLLVACADGFLELQEIQFAGGKRLAAGEIAHNFPLLSQFN